MNNDYNAILKRYWNYDSFRPLQLETIEAVCGGRDTLVLMPTGGGKSIIYQVPALAMEGVCIVVTPLIALMKDQVDALRRRGILAAAVHAGLTPRDTDRILDNCVYGDVKFLYISPERIGSEMFRMRFERMNVSLIAVDEAHCISQWGYDFRPAYLQIARLRKIHPETTVLALTASATTEVMADIMQRLEFRAPNLLRMSFARPNLSYVVRRTEDKRTMLVRILANVAGSSIVYVRTRDKAETIAQFLKEQGLTAEFYHGGMGYLMRSMRQDDWLTGRTRVMVATNAFGMGIDKRDVRTVIHYDPCDSIEAYYQEAGRAGRDGDKAYAVLLASADDTPRSLRRVQLDFPPIETIRRIYESLCDYLGIAIGDGKDTARSINIYEFAAQYGFFVPTVINAAAILELNGYLTLTDETDHPSRIHFTVARDELYRMRVNRKELDTILTLLLRRYSGLFTDFVPIDEDELIHLSGYTAERLHELLKQLWQLHIIKYIPGGRSPMVVFTEERLPVEALRISPESYARRKEVALQRIEGMNRYATNDEECRSVVIQRYFGEEKPTPCGVCDLCLARRRPAVSDKALQKALLDRLSRQPESVRSLSAALSYDSDRIIKAVDRLLNAQKIVEDDEGKLRINP